MIDSYAAEWLLEDHPRPTAESFWRHVDTQPSASYGWRGECWPDERSTDCLAAMGDGRRCTARPTDAPFCDRHLERARTWFRMLDLRQEVRDASPIFIGDVKSTITTARLITAYHRDDLVYFWEIDGAGVVKIGHSKQVATRTAQFLTGKGCTFPPNVDPKRGHLLGTTPGGHTVERALHMKYRHLWVVGEWFRLDEELATEITSLTTDSQAA